MTETLLAPTFLFHFSAPLLRCKKSWTAKGVQLDAKYELPSFGELEDRLKFADVRAAWNDNGLFFNVRVSGKKQSPWCRGTRLDDSDGLHVWIDTRDTHNIHRASRFCHRFVFTPAGGGRKLEDSVADLIDINRAREKPKPCYKARPLIRSEKRVDGYLLESHIPTESLTGFNPSDHPRLGFAYAVVDRELGWQTFSVGAEFPFADDPSLWGTLELAGA